MLGGYRITSITNLKMLGGYPRSNMVNVVHGLNSPRSIHVQIKSLHLIHYTYWLPPAVDAQD